MDVWLASAILVLLLLFIVFKLGEIKGTKHSRGELSGTRTSESVDFKLIHTIIQDIPDAIGLMDENFVYQACNTAFVIPLGIDSPDKLIGHRLEDVVSEEMFLEFNDSDRRVLSTGIPYLITHETKNENGAPLWMDARKFRFINPVTNRPGIFIIARDVTQAEVNKQELNRARDNFQKLSMSDSLTQIGNRRLFNETLDAEWKNHIRNEMPFSLIMCDIDEFKKLNDTKGHLHGDEVLVSVAKALKKALKRPMDNVYRYGGEEFAFILCDTDSPGAGTVADRIHEEIQALAIEHPTSSVNEHVTVSLGVHTCYPSAETDSIEAVQHVDQTLYRAKEQGRNRTVQSGLWYRKDPASCTQISK